MRLKEKSEDLAIQMGNVNERFWRIIGQVKTLFDDSKIVDFINEIEKSEEVLGDFEKDIYKGFGELDREIIKGIESICKDENHIKIYSENPNNNRNSLFVEKLAKLENLKESMYKDANAKIKMLESKINDLLDYLENEITNPQFSRECKLFCSSKICPLKPPSTEDLQEKASDASEND